jgi:hypothetical protein
MTREEAIDCDLMSWIALGRSDGEAVEAWEEMEIGKCES